MNVLQFIETAPQTWFSNYTTAFFLDLLTGPGPAYFWTCLLASPLARMSWNSSLDFVFQCQDLPCSFTWEGQYKPEQCKLRSVVLLKQIPYNSNEKTIPFRTAALPRV